KWGAEGPDRFDCSGLMQSAYRHAGLTIPRTSGQQYHAGKHVPVDQARPGDLIFWADAAGNPSAIHHVALYIGNNQVIQAPQTGETVKISDIWDSELVPKATRPA
ncbi:NlpC/P60 family protein, partial [Actinopolyspora alba]